MGLKLRAELEVRLTIVAMLVVCRRRNDVSAPCEKHDQMRGLPCRRVEEQKGADEHMQ